MLELILSCLVSTIVLLNAGNIFCAHFFKINIYQSKNYSENSLYGIIGLSFLALFINFFFPLNKFVGTLFLSVSLFIFLIYFIKTSTKKYVIYYILYTSILTFVLLLLSNINRPDAGLYHLPYTSLINENKIIIGASNIHFRFGHISIIQYLSALFNNFIFSTSMITVPLASLVSVFLVYLLKNFIEFISNNNISQLLFLILIFCIFSFNR